MTFAPAALLQPDRGQPARLIHVVHPDRWAEWLNAQPPRIRTTVAAHRLTGKAGNRAVLPGDGPDDWAMLLVCNESLESPWRIASLGDQLPEGTYRLAEGEPGAAMLGWCLAQHKFDRYRSDDSARGPRVLLTGEPAKIDETVHLALATAKVRDLVNTPAADLGPAELEAEAKALAEAHAATLTVTKGEALATGYPMIHTVGQAAAKGREPRLIELEGGVAVCPLSQSPRRVVAAALCIEARAGALLAQGFDYDEVFLKAYFLFSLGPSARLEIAMGERLHLYGALAGLVRPYLPEITYLDTAGVRQSITRLSPLMVSAAFGISWSFQ